MTEWLFLEKFFRTLNSMIFSQKSTRNRNSKFNDLPVKFLKSYEL